MTDNKINPSETNNNTNNNTASDDARSSIHDFDFSLICEYFASIDRQGPGCDEATRRALAFVPGINADSRIADIGCGTGSSAILLAADTGAHVTAVDLFPMFLERLTRRAADRRVADRITTLAASMDALPFADNSLDLIWCEGAIYNIGFENGLRSWHRMLRDGGYIAVTDATWLTETRPAEVADFWEDAYPAITDIATNIATMQRCGYTPVATFVLPVECWTANFYEPQQSAQRIFLSRHGDDRTAQSLVANQQHEAAIYDRYHDYYGYVFYIARKNH